MPEYADQPSYPHNPYAKIPTPVHDRSRNCTFLKPQNFLPYSKISNLLSALPQIFSSDKNTEAFFSKWNLQNSIKFQIKVLLKWKFCVNIISKSNTGFQQVFSKQLFPMTIKNLFQNLMNVAVFIWTVGSSIAMADNTVRGRITDQYNKPVASVKAILLNAKTKMPVKWGESNDSGEFSIEKVNPDEYILSVSLLGFKKFETEKFVLAVNSKDVVVEKNVILQEAGNVLKEAIVTSKQSFIEQQADKMIINPEASITTASDNVLDILKNTPGIFIDNNDNISLKGKQGIKVLIDEKPTYVSAEQLSSLLKSMQAKDVERIEIIENPSSRYDAEGSSGIINIKTKHIKRTGFNGSVFGTLGYNDKWSGNGGLNMNMNFGKLNVYGNYSYNSWAGWNNSIVQYKTVTGTYQSIDGNYDYEGYAHNIKIGADYYLTKKQVLSVMFRGSDGNNECPFTSDTRLENSQHQLDSLLKGNTEQNDKWRNYTYNLNYKWDIDTLGQSLTVDADYARFFSESINDQQSRFYTPSGDDLNHYSDVLAIQKSRINILTGKADYVLPINKIFSLEAGLKSSFVTNHANSDFDINDPSGSVQNSGLMTSDQFIYTENINAAYASGRGKFDKTSVQLGLRVENTNSRGDSKSMNRVDNHHYTNLFPTLFVQQTLNKDNQLGFQYSYRIGRPSYDLLNPFLWMLNLYTYVQGNPFLTPQYTHSLGLNYTYKNKFITSAGFNTTNDMFTEVIEQNLVSKLLYQTNKNLSKSIDLNLSETAQLDITKWWHLNATTTVMYKKTASDDESIEDFSKWSFNGNMSNTFMLPRDYSFEVSGWYSSKQLSGYFEIDPMYCLNLGLQKKLFKKNGTLKLSLRDVLDTNNSTAKANYGNLDVNSKWHGSTRMLNLSFTYNFGKDTFKTRVDRSTSSSDEQDRSNSSKSH
jgi:hypothetical protein